MKTEKNLTHLKNGGAWVPSVTIFQRGRKRVVNIPATVHHVITLAKHGAEGVIINGTTGEGHLLSVAEKCALIIAVGKAKLAKEIPSDFILISGTGTESLQEAKEIIATADAQGFHGALVLPPKNEGQKEEFYIQLAASTSPSFGIILYHHPRLDPSYSITPGMLGELMSKCSNIIGVKDSSGDKNLLYTWAPVTKEFSGHELLLAVGEDFFVADGLTSAGAKAAIAGAANTPRGLKELKKIFHAHRTNDEKTLRAAQARFDREINSLLMTGVFRNNAKRRRIRAKTRDN
jgi:dihydrodipicolinate synthase/N-acetylneuraminate lyase